MDDMRKMTIVDDSGKEVEVEILFTFESEDTGYSYVIFTDGKSEDTYFAYRYDEDGNLDEVTEEEAEMCDEIFNLFLEENMI